MNNNMIADQISSGIFLSLFSYEYLKQHNKLGQFQPIKLFNYLVGTTALKTAANAIFDSNTVEHMMMKITASITIICSLFNTIPYHDSFYGKSVHFGLAAGALTTYFDILTNQIANTVINSDNTTIQYENWEISKTVFISGFAFLTRGIVSNSANTFTHKAISGFLGGLSKGFIIGIYKNDSELLQHMLFDGINAGANQFFCIKSDIDKYLDGITNTLIVEQGMFLIERGYLNNKSIFANNTTPINITFNNTTNPDVNEYLNNSMNDILVDETLYLHN